MLLQQDIATAVEFLQVATDEPVDFDDPFWGIPLDRRRGRWAALPEALPFEGDNARRLFPTRAMHYLGDFNGAIPLEHRFDNARIEKLIKAWWPASVALRRFCLAFERLHQHDAGQINEDNLVQLSEETPTEFLLLCALHTERLITERYLQTPPRSSKTPGFGRLMLETAAEIKAAFGIADPAFEQELACALEERTKLHDLAHNPRDPFIPATEFATSDPTARAFLRCLTNFAIMRNYAAHHDCLDRDLYSNRWVAAPVEAMVATVLATLTLPR